MRRHAAVRRGMGDHRAAVAEQAAWGASGRRPTGDQRHPLAVSDRRPMARCAGALRPAHDALQPVRALAGGGRVGPSPGGGVKGLRRRHRDDRTSSCVRMHQHGAAVKRGVPMPGTVRMGRSRGGLTTKIHALVDADGRPVRLRADPRARRATRLSPRPCWRTSRPARSCAPTGPMTPTPSASSLPSATHGPTSRPARSARAASPSQPGSTGKETWSSAPSIASNSTAAWPPATTASPRTTSQLSSSQLSASGSQRY